MTKLLLISVIAISLVGCATGTELLIEQVYPAIEDHTFVYILRDMPEGAEQIAVLKAFSGSPEMSPRQRIENAVDDLKRRAAKVGANAVVLTDRNTTAQAMYGGQLAGDTHRLRLVGIAIR